jgi:hypothetical protein
MNELKEEWGTTGIATKKMLKKLTTRFKEARKLEKKMLKYRSIYQKLAILDNLLRAMPDLFIEIQDLQSAILAKLQKQKVGNVSYVYKFTII